jgi:hypothetical protein
VWDRETTVVKPVLSHHLYDGAVTVEGVGEGDYCGQACFKSLKTNLTTVVSLSHTFYSEGLIIEVVT